MPNPIKYTDLFEGVDEGLGGLIRRVGEVQTSLTTMLAEVKKQAQEVGTALAGTSSVTKGDRDATSAYAAKIEELHNANEKLTKGIESLQNQLDGLKKRKNNDRQETDALKTSYASLQNLLEATKVNLDELALSEKARTQVAKNGQIANNALGGSYNQLYAQYNLVKTALNSMTDSMRNSEKVGKMWEAEALRIMNAMKAMQEATGKHTLSVGDYTKAFNGLSISTQQVLRELPTLANSWSQFFIAISNNVPIFVDNLKRVKDETGSWMVAMKGVLTSVFSWQTALLVVLTILPKVAKAIHDKKKAQEEEAKAQEKATKSTEEGIKAYKTLLEIYNEIAIAASKSITEVSTLNAILEDNNRTWEDRVDAGKRLKEIFDKELEGFSAEEIAMGKAKVQMQTLTTLIYEQAKARASLNEITQLTEKYLEAEGRSKLYENYMIGTRTVKEYSEALDEANAKGQKIHLGAAEQEAVDTYRSILSEMRGFQNQINAITDQIRPKLLLEDEDTNRAKDNLGKVKDYYWDYLEAMANMMEDEESREIKLSAISYNRKIASLKQELEENKNLTEEQTRYITGIILSLENERGKERLAIIKKWNEKISKEYAEDFTEASLGGEEDMSISARYDKLLAENADKLLASRESLNEKVKNGTYREAKEEGKIFKDLTIEKLRLEEQLQEELLKMRFETGAITAEQYEVQLADLQTKLDNSIANLNKRKKGKFNIWNLILGETQTDGKGNVWREMSSESQAFTKAFEESMKMAFDYMDEWMDKRIEMAEIAVEAAERESEAAKTALDYEMEARANGYANNVDLARKEYEEKLALEQKAVEEKEKLEKQQEAIDSAQQLSSLITATANILASYSSLPLVGQILSMAAIATMFGTFAAAKITAANATKYGEGMSEYLDYGGSHASGHDIDFGADKNGRRRRVERGEIIGVINKKNVEKYGVRKVTDIINSLNKGTFEEKYSSFSNTLNKESISNLSRNSDMRRRIDSITSLADVVLPEMRSDLYQMAFDGFERDGVELGGIESRLQTLIEQGETRVVSTPTGRIEYRGNNKRIIHNS